MWNFHITLFLGCLINFGYGGHVTVSNAPSSLHFKEKTQNVLRLSELSDVVGAAMGYTTKNTLWDGLTVLSPFKVPSKAVVVSIPTHNTKLHFHKTCYDVIEDSSVQEFYDDLKEKVHETAQRPVYFNFSEVTDVATGDVVASTSLDVSNDFDREFLLEVTALRDLLAQKKQMAEQDFLFYELKSFAGLVNVYGDASPQVEEAKSLLAGSLEGASKGGALVLVVALDSGEAPHHRNLLLTDLGKEIGHVTLAGEYSEDFAAIFSIILFLSLVLIVALYMVVASMAYMDPGRDSIIYRMTNPRIKKDN